MSNYTIDLLKKYARILSEAEPAPSGEAITQQQLTQLYAKGTPIQFIKNTPVALVPLAQLNQIGTPQQIQQIQQLLGSVDQTSYTDEYKNKGYLPESLLNGLALLGWNPPQREDPNSLSGDNIG